MFLLWVLSSFELTRELMAPLQLAHRCQPRKNRARLDASRISAADRTAHCRHLFLDGANPMSKQNNGPETGVYRTANVGGYIGRPPTSAPARPDARNQNQASAKPAKPTMTDEQIDAAVKAGMKRMESPTAGQTPAKDPLTREARIRLAHRTLLAQVAQVPLDQVGTLRHE
jgi:hypothetical protein